MLVDCGDNFNGQVEDAAASDSGNAAGLQAGLEISTVM